MTADVNTISSADLKRVVHIFKAANQSASEARLEIYIAIYLLRKSLFSQVDPLLQDAYQLCQHLKYELMPVHNQGIILKLSSFLILSQDVGSDTGVIVHETL